MERLKDEPLDMNSLWNKLIAEIGFICEEYNIPCQDNKILPRQWSFVVNELCRRIIKPNVNDLMKTSDNKFNQYDKTKVLDIYNIYKRLSSLYSQENTITMFCDFSGIDKQTIYNWSSDGSFDLHKIIQADDETSLEQMLQDPRLNPMKILPSLNKKFSWSLPGVTHESKGRALTLGKLPELSAENTPNLPDFSQNSEP